MLPKGQSISKADRRAINSPKQRMDEFVLFAFLLFAANKSNSSVHCLGESAARQSAFQFYLTFSATQWQLLFDWQPFLKTNKSILINKITPVFIALEDVKSVVPSKGHILFFHNQGTRSHIFVMSALAQALLDHGYTITTVFYAKSNIIHENYNEILIEDT